MRQLRSLRVRKGKGLTGWVAETGEVIVNGNPMVEPGFVDNPGHPAVLKSALAIPLFDGQNTVGVLALYRLQPDSFTAQSLEMVRPIAQQLATAVSAWQEHEIPPQALETFWVGAPVGAESRQ